MNGDNFRKVIEELDDATLETIEYFRSSIEPVICRYYILTKSSLQSKIKNLLKKPFIDEKLKSLVLSIFQEEKSSQKYFEISENLASYFFKMRKKLAQVSANINKESFTTLINSYAENLLYFTALLELTSLTFRNNTCIEDFENWSLRNTIHEVLTLLNSFHNLKKFILSQLKQTKQQ